LPAISCRNLVADFEAAHFDIFSNEHDGLDHEPAPLRVAPLALCPLAPFVETQLLDGFSQLSAAVKESSKRIEETNDCWRRDAFREESSNSDELTALIAAILEPSAGVLVAPDITEIESSIMGAALRLAQFRNAFAFAHFSIADLDADRIESFVNEFAFDPADWRFVDDVVEELGIGSCLKGLDEMLERYSCHEAQWQPPALLNS